MRRKSGCQIFIIRSYRNVFQLQFFYNAAANSSSLASKRKKEFPKQVGTGQTVAQSTSLLVNPSWLSSTTSKTAAATLRAII